MKRFKTILIAAAVGGAVGALLTITPLRHFHLASIFDRGAIAGWPWMCSALGWVAFSLYWEASAKNAAQAKSAETPASRQVHVFLANIALLLEFLPIGGAGRLLPGSAAVALTGLIIEAGGLALAILARRFLGRNWSGEISIKVDHELIRSGPYRKLRHPIYTGLLAMYLGTAIVSGTWLAPLGFLVAIAAYARKIRLEEVNLRKAFGADYEAYCRASWALVPGLY